MKLFEEIQQYNKIVNLFYIGLRQDAEIVPLAIADWYIKWLNKN